MSNHITPANRPFVVCARCEGHGTHANPAFDGMSASVDEFDGSYDERDEFLDAYTTRGGMYDVSCEDCNGQRVVRAECECDDCEEERADLADMYAMERAERAFGC